ncbi:hypothetical protein KCP74_17775 [Salmonella enterica subsp. enterica]|nr:hypothetical protein KCP74_17775 [Salmonella enterica subsp. enterica]
MIAQPITYEDFLPVSAAGIFQSIWEMKRWPEATAMPARDAEQALGCAVRDEFSLLYQEAEERGKRAVAVCFKKR